MRFAKRGLAGLVAAALVSGCGGGGGDDASSPPSSGPLAITTENAATAAQLGPAMGEAILTVAQFGADSIRRFSAAGTASPAVSTCSNGGLLTVSLLDKDADGVASVGDQVTVEARDCLVPVVADTVNGTMQLTLRDATALPAGSVRATLDTGAGLRFGTANGVNSTLMGSLQFDWSASDLQVSLHVTPGALDDLRIVGTASTGGSLTESIRQPDLSRVVKYNEARTATTLAFRYESQALKGSITVSTPQPLLSYLNTYPEQGRMEVAGARGSKAIITPNYVNSSGQFAISLDSNGDGTVDASGVGDWSGTVLGYLWWDGRSSLASTTSAYTTRSFSTTDFTLSASMEWKTSTTTRAYLQFSRPLASTTPTLYFRFADQGASSYDGSSSVNVPATALRDGALIIVTPTTALRHGRTYDLQVSLDGSAWGSGVTVQDTLGNTLGNYFWSSQRLITPDTLRAVPVVAAGVLTSASDQLQLDGLSSTSAVRPITGYRWTQVSGTPLQISDPSSAKTTVSWGATAPTGVEKVVLQLTVTDAAGDTDTREVTVNSGNLAAVSQVLFFRSTKGDYIGGGATTLITNEAASFQQSASSGRLSASVTSSTGFEWWYLSLAAADGLPLHVGAYENAARFGGSGVNGLDFSGSGRGCNSTAGRFDVLEAQTDANGTLTKLAVDFEQHCESATAPALYGSYRFNSSVPLRK